MQHLQGGLAEAQFGEGAVDLLQRGHQAHAGKGVEGDEGQHIGEFAPFGRQQHEQQDDHAAQNQPLQSELRHLIDPG